MATQLSTQDVAEPRATLERTAVIAVGGNALILDGQRGTIAEQFDNARETARHVAALVKDGWRVVLTHGNGPQVGFILLRSELVAEGWGPVTSASPSAPSNPARGARRS